MLRPVVVVQPDQGVDYAIKQGEEDNVDWDCAKDEPVMEHFVRLDVATPACDDLQLDAEWIGR